MIKNKTFEAYKKIRKETYQTEKTFKDKKKYSRKQKHKKEY